jgi:predicted PurR-regulated permease PerM
VPVEIRRSAFSPLEIIQKILGSFLNVVVTAGIVIVFVIFMLIERTDLRDRVIRLGGARRVNATTRMLDDASQRVSRYLLRQLVINAAFGTVAAVGLYFIGVPNPFLWGLVAALLRYVPYLGIWIAAAMPAVLAFAVEPGWVKVPIVFGLYFGIDLIMYNFVEPLLYGNSTGHPGRRSILDLALGTGWVAAGHAPDGLCRRAGQAYPPALVLADSSN